MVLIVKGLLLVFYPLYPWTIGAASIVFHNALVSALAVSTLASLAAAVELYRLTALDHTRCLAREQSDALKGLLTEIGYAGALTRPGVAGRQADADRRASACRDDAEGDGHAAGARCHRGRDR